MTWHSKKKPRIHTRLNFYGIWMKSQNRVRLWYEKEQFHANPWTKCELGKSHHLSSINQRLVFCFFHLHIYIMIHHLYQPMHFCYLESPRCWIGMGGFDCDFRSVWSWAPKIHLYMRCPCKMSFFQSIFFWNLRATASFKGGDLFENSVAILASIFIPLFFCACLGCQTWDNKPLKP